MSNNRNKKLKQVIFKSRTFDFSEKQMMQYRKDIQNGRTRNEALARLLGCPTGKNSEDFLRKNLTENEYEILNLNLTRSHPN